MGNTNKQTSERAPLNVMKKQKPTQMLLLMHHVGGGMFLFVEAFAQSFGRMSNICTSSKQDTVCYLFTLCWR